MEQISVDSPLSEHNSAPSTGNVGAPSMSNDETVPLTAKEALEMTKKVRKTQTATQEKKEVFTLEEGERQFQLNFLQEGIRESAELGLTEFACVYNSIDTDTGEPDFTLEYFIAVVDEFKLAFPHFKVLYNYGPQRKLTIDWSGKNES